MALTQADLDALDLAIASGELTVSHAGRTVTYQSTDSLLKARKHVADVLRSQAGSSRPPTFGGLGYGLASFNHGD
ncbi:phage head-tail joining protein [Delftia sp. PS-11]|uniref:phage head-tail joining protein n=1 Tax=Delftia sp. PS-11 TaxID=2767222 RepID=UPI002455FC40|nr:hypothetical protein [Delftia sp. PS-11]KAJ8744596.1 hypothetical protein H9T68_11640 [Delftia sp. PS-11]